MFYGGKIEIEAIYKTQKMDIIEEAYDIPL